MVAQCRSACRFTGLWKKEKPPCSAFLYQGSASRGVREPDRPICWRSEAGTQPDENFIFFRERTTSCGLSLSDIRRGAPVLLRARYSVVFGSMEQRCRVLIC